MLLFPVVTNVRGIKPGQRCCRWLKRVMEEVGIGSLCSLCPGVFHAQESRWRLTNELETVL